PLAVRRPESVRAARLDRTVLDDLVEELVRVGEQLARLLAVARVLEDLRERAFQLPGREEEGPVEVRPELLQRRLDRPRPGEGRLREVGGVPRDLGAPLGGDPYREQRGLLPLRVLGAQTRLQLPVLSVE